MNGLDGTNFLAGALAADLIFKARVSGDANERMGVRSDGKITFGSGSGATDVTLERLAADVLGLSADHFKAAGGLRIPVKAGIPADGDYVLDEDGNIALDTTNHALYVRSGGTWRKIAASDIAYVEATSPVSVTSTTEATPDDVVSAGSITFDGAAVWVEFFVPYFNLPASAGGVLTATLWNDATQIGRLFAQEAESATVRAQHGGTFKRKITPTAGAHTIKVAAFVSTGTGVIGAGTGVTTAYEPAFILITRA